VYQPIKCVGVIGVYPPKKNVRAIGLLVLKNLPSLISSTCPYPNQGGTNDGTWGTID